MLSDDEISALMNIRANPQIVADRLTGAALNRGGNDNISVIIIDILSVRPSRAATAAALAANNVAAASETESEEAAGSYRKRRSRLGVLTFILLFVLLIAGAIGGVWLYANNTAFLRLENNQVMVYRGLPGDILPGVRLEWLEDTTDLTKDDLLSTTAGEMQSGIRFDDLNAAYEQVAYLQASRDERSAGRNK